MRTPREILRNENLDQGEGGGGGFADLATDSTVEPEGGGGDGGGEVTEVEPAATAAPASPDVNQVLTLANQVLQNQQVQQAPAPPPPPSQEQIDQMLKVYKLTPDVFSKVFDDALEVEERMAAFQDILNGVSTHAITVAGVTSRLASDQIRDQFAPVMTAHEAKVQEDFVDGVVSDYPGLKPHKEFLNSVVTQMKAEDYRVPAGPQGGQIARQEVANRAAQVIAQVQPGFDVRTPAAQQHQQTSGGGLPAMADGGAGGGAGGVAAGGSPNTAKKPWQEIFS